VTTLLDHADAIGSDANKAGFRQSVARLEAQIAQAVRNY
jgi:hypothetical protein